VLASAAGQPSETVIDCIFEAIDYFAGGAPQFDDMTILVARRL
jgi:serine phosphatase RsbU (regulator of sigma subunit)